MAIPFRQLMRLAAEAGVALSPDVIESAARSQIPTFSQRARFANRTRGGMFGLPEGRTAATLPSWMAGNVFDAPPSAVRASVRQPLVEPGVVPRRPVPESVQAREAISALLGTRAGRPRRRTFRGYQYRDVIDAPGIGALGRRGRRADVTRAGAERLAAQRTPGMATLEDFLSEDDVYQNILTRVALAGQMNDARALQVAEDYALKYSNFLNNDQIDTIGRALRGYRERIGLEVGEEVAPVTGRFSGPMDEETLRAYGEGAPLFKLKREDVYSIINAIPKMQNLRDIGEAWEFAIKSDLMENKTLRDQVFRGLELRANEIVKEQLRRRFMASTRTLADQLDIKDVSSLTSAQFDDMVNEAVENYMNAKLMRASGVQLLPQGGKSSQYNQTTYLSAIRTSFNTADLTKVGERMKKLADKGVIPTEELATLRAAYGRQLRLIRTEAFKPLEEYMEREAFIDLRDLNTKTRAIIQLESVKPKRDYQSLRTRSKGVRPAYADTAAYTEGQPANPSSFWRGAEGDLTLQEWAESKRAADWADEMRAKTSYVSSTGRVQEPDALLTTNETAQAKDIIKALEGSTDPEDMKIVAQMRRMPPDEFAFIPPSARARVPRDVRSTRVRPISYQEAGLTRPFVVGETGEEVLGPPSQWLAEVAGAERVKAAPVNWKDNDWFRKPLQKVDPQLGISKQEWVDNYGYRNLVRIKQAETLRDADRALSLVMAARSQGLVDEAFWKLTVMEYGIKVKSLQNLAFRATMQGKAGKRGFRTGKDSRFRKTKAGTFVRPPTMRETFTSSDEMWDYVGPQFSIRMAG